MGNFFFRALLLGLGLATALPAAAGIDCNAPANWAQDTICRSKALSEMQREMETLAADARARSQDPEAFDASQRQWAAERRDACNTARCLHTSYHSRRDELQLQITSGRPPLVTPGTYHRHGAPDDAEAGIALWIGLADGGRYRLRVLSSGEDAVPVEGEFTGRVGSARFTAPGCAFELAFAPDVIALSGAAGELCGEALEGSYLLGTD